MRLVSKYSLGVVVLLMCAFGSWWCQRVRLPAVQNGIRSPSPAAEMIVAGLGGLRSIATEVVWFRADRLQDEGRYAELAQLASWLTFLEPHTPEVWAFAAWNLAYNVSVMMPTPADRWRWVEASLRLLREDGLRLNPSEPTLYKEIAWTFLLKLAGPLDDAGPYYRDAWKKLVQDVQLRQAWNELGMEKTVMDLIDKQYGKQDWTNPLASSLYWATLGMELVRTNAERRDLRRILYQTLMLEARQDAGFAPRALLELRQAYREDPSSLLKEVIGNFRGQFNLD